MTENRRILYAMALTFALVSPFMSDEPWGMRLYLYAKREWCPNCWHGRECDLNYWTAEPEQVPKETLKRIPGYDRPPK